mmetsp:Transcript_23500/g.41650  ORF Transcript_23500/g.41650 Transcript_23500/m.41650 type:complete len:492 (-) Transcript_23500:448-1923(-)
MISAYYMLTAVYLVQCRGQTKSLHKRSVISWKKLEPVVKDGPTCYYGFRLYSSYCSETFFAENLQEQKIWLNLLSKACILTNFDTDYELMGELGRGSFSVVMKGKDKVTKDIVAVKLVRKVSQGIEGCLKEITLMRRLSHESVISVMKVYDWEEHIAIILEYLAGGSMFDYIIRNKRLTETQAKAFITKLLSGLDFCHSKLCVHRDIKLENVLLANENDLSNIRIADFGLAADLEVETLGKRCGSAGYVAPEIILNRPQSEKVDIFSAGVILYMCLSGTAPFGGHNESAVLKANSKCSFELESIYWAHISSDAKDLTKRMMNKEPLQRLTAKEALTHSWLTRLERIDSPAAIEITESPITQSPKVTSKTLTDVICKRIEETKCDYLNVLAGRSGSSHAEPLSPASPSPISPLTPNANHIKIRRLSQLITTESTSPKDNDEVRESRRRSYNPGFSDFVKRIGVSPDPQKVKVKSIKYKQVRPNLLDPLYKQM